MEDQRVKFLQGHPRGLTDYQKFRLLLKKLRKRFPPRYPVRVRRPSGKSLKGQDAPYGVCWLSNDNKSPEDRYFTIYISCKYPIETQIDTLLHEWAHALTWFKCKPGQDHGDPWSEAYGKLYREYIED